MTTLHESAPEKPAQRRSTGEAASLIHNQQQQYQQYQQYQPQQQQQQQQQTSIREQDSGSASNSGPSSLVPESLSSASSFQSLASSIGSKSSSGICADSAPASPEHHPGATSSSLDATVIVPSETSLDASYVNVDIPDLDDLISACQRIDLGPSDPVADGPNDKTYDRDDDDDDDEEAGASDCSQDQTFASAADDTTLITADDSVLQTFKTCSAVATVAEFEAQLSQITSTSPGSQENVFKAPLPVNPQKSVVPYVSVEPRSLRAEPEDVFKSALNSFSEPPSTEETRRSCSPTPCIEIDVAEAVRARIESGEKSFVSARGDVAPAGELDNFTVADDQNKKQNHIVLKTPDATFEEVQTLNSTHTLNAESNAQESEEISTKTPEKLNLSALKDTNINDTFPITNNSETHTDKELDDKSLKEEKNKSLILEEKSPRKIVNVLNTTTTPPKNTNISIQDISPPKNVQIKTPTKLDIIIDQETTSPEKINDIYNVSKTHLVQKETISPIKADYIEEKNTYNNKESEALNQSNTENLRNLNSLNREVIASTPLPTKNSSKKETPKNKSALFSEKINSPVIQNPQEQCIKQDNTNQVNLNETVPVNKISEKSLYGGALELIAKENFELTNALNDDSLNLLPDKEPENVDYEAFKPQQQSTSLPFPKVDYKALQEAALDVAKDIDASLEKIEESEQFVSATTEIFEDPSAFDFLNQHGSQPASRGDRYDSLFLKFDPLAQRLSMMPQKNTSNTPAEVEDDQKEIKMVNEPICNATPKKNPALAAIDRLLFESPASENFTSKVLEEAKAKQKEEEEKPQSPLVTLVDEKMVKELELVRSSVIQLEEELEKQKQEHKKQFEKQKQDQKQQLEKLKQEHKQQLEKMKTACEDKIIQIQSQLSQEVKCKDQMAVVVEEYEKSISRLIAEREKDKSSLETEKARLQEELDFANQHLSKTEAAFSDVHSKYERLKMSIAAYRSNEAVLKESIAENQETIKTLENRYEQLKSHAMAQLEKANMELEAIRKQNDAESIKLKALLRKSELKSKSLEETVEQKMKENKELTKIIDEMIARVN